MNKRGRPKSPIKSKNRVHAVLFSLRAEITFNEENQRRRTQGFKELNLSQYISEYIIKDFELDPTGYIKQRLIDNNKKIDHLMTLNQELAQNITKLKEQNQKKKVWIENEVMD